MLFALIPPTPTAPPVAPTAPLNIPSIGVWETTDDFIGMWNQHPGPTRGLQIAIIVALILATVFVVWFLIQKLFVRDSD